MLPVDLIHTNQRASEASPSQSQSADRRVSVAQIAQTSGVAFGTSGARGLVSAMNDLVCFVYTAGFLGYLQELGQFEQGRAVALAGDLRPSSPRILRACAAAVRAMGGTVVFAGFVPSPAVSLYGFTEKLPSMMVTGSHIPDDRNGIKFNRADGELLKSDEAGVFRQEVTVPSGWFDESGYLISPLPLDVTVDVLTPYANRYFDFYGGKALAGMTIGVYEHSAVGRDVLGHILTSLGATTVSLGRSAQFIPVDTEAVRPEDSALAERWAGEQKFDAIVSTDGDSDRPLLADEQGRWLRGDVLGILTAHALGAQTVVTPVSTNSALEKSGWFDRIIRTRIGSPFVISGMTEAIAQGAHYVCGFEANGGFLVASKFTRDNKTLAALPTRDAVLPIVAVLIAARKRGLPVSSLAAELPPRFAHSDRIKAFSGTRSQALLSPMLEADQPAQAEFDRRFLGVTASKSVAIDVTDGVRVTLANDEIVHLRPSGNAPELRCYTEADTLERAQQLCAMTLATIQNGEQV